MKNLKHLLDRIPAARCSYHDWLTIGMALKNEDYGVEVWDDWSKEDPRYKPGECAKKWDTFNGSDRPVKAEMVVRIVRK